MGLVSPAQVTDGTTADASDINNPINTIANEFNGNIDNANIKAAAAIAGSKLADASVTPGKMSAIKLFPAIGGSYTGSPPAANGTFYMMAGSDAPTFASNSATITFSTPFPNGLLTAVAVQGDITLGAGVGFNVATVSDKTKLILNCAVNGAARVNWIAIGW